MISKAQYFKLIRQLRACLEANSSGVSFLTDFKMIQPDDPCWPKPEEIKRSQLDYADGALSSSETVLPEKESALDTDSLGEQPEQKQQAVQKFSEPENSSVCQPEDSESQVTLLELRAQWSNCQKCRLAETRQNIVFGEGDSDARLMLIGEGPGANEDRTGIPFVGKAGKLLDKMIVAMGLDRKQIFIANIVKCRPPGNRDPLPNEVEQCISALKKQIDIIKPEVILALGRVAAQTLLDSKSSLGKLRLKWHTYQGIPLLPTYHPAYLLRNPAAKRKSWEDLQMAMQKLGLKIDKP
ncbi:MAG: uracil-DNA glycosylase [Deltaproteobacteria bacterium]|jgi:uracil-DNA glycosylase family 4|nr:uracil-DNA glycosylase [Deltaproteobacteria bacterium]